MSGEVMANSDGAAIDDLDVLDWFEHSDLAQAITTHAMASGILRMRERVIQGRKRRTDAGVKRKLGKCDAGTGTVAMKKDDQPTFEDLAKGVPK